MKSQLTSEINALETLKARKFSTFDKSRSKTSTTAQLLYMKAKESKLHDLFEEIKNKESEMDIIHKNHSIRQEDIKIKKKELEKLMNQQHKKKKMEKKLLIVNEGVVDKFIPSSKTEYIMEDLAIKEEERLAMFQQKAEEEKRRIQASIRQDRQLAAVAKKTEENDKINEQIRSVQAMMMLREAGMSEKDLEKRKKAEDKRALLRERKKKQLQTIAQQRSKEMESTRHAARKASLIHNEEHDSIDINNQKSVAQMAEEMKQKNEKEKLQKYKEAHTHGMAHEAHLNVHYLYPSYEMLLFVHQRYFALYAKF
jgi:hypothetical protein